MDADSIHHSFFETLRKQCLEVEFKCGDWLGPFSLDHGESSIKITLLNFTGEMMAVEMESNAVTRRIQTISSPLFSNCAILQNGSTFQILFTKNVTKSEALRATLIADMSCCKTEKEEKAKLEIDKKHECPNCHVAKFNSLQNLKVHEELYCPKRDVPEAPKNVILLPIAIHDLPQKGAVQVLGPVHTIVPVAVGRDSTLLNTNPIFVHQNSNVKLPTNLEFSSQNLTVKIPIIDLEKFTAPLDLSSSSRAASIPSVSPSCSPTSKSSSSESPFPDRPFSCQCGVSFSNQTTFDAHRKLYCVHTASGSSRSGLGGGGGSRSDGFKKLPEKCSKCDFVPVSASQLAMHIRSAHQTTKTFTCLVCGYRAFSMRGVRTHMRSHPNDDSQKFKANDDL